MQQKLEKYERKERKVGWLELLRNEIRLQVLHGVNGGKIGRQEDRSNWSARWLGCLFEWMYTVLTCFSERETSREQCQKLY